MWIFVLQVVLCVLQNGRAFFFNEYAQVTYCSNATNTDECKMDVLIYVNSLNTAQNIIPYEYHDFDFCVPENDVANSPPMNFGQVVFGDRIRPSLYKMVFTEKVTCKKVCEKTYKPEEKEKLEKLAFLIHGIKLDYQHHWILDNVPITWCHKIWTGEMDCSTGFPIGCYISKDSRRMIMCHNLESVIPWSSKNDHNATYYLFNHVDIVVEYRRLNSEGRTQQLGINGHILSAKLMFRSLDSGNTKDEESCGLYLPALSIPADLKKEIKIKYTYSVKWVENNYVKWTSRWNYIFKSMSYTNIKINSLMVSVVIAAFLFGITVMVMRQTLCKNISQNNQTDTMENDQENFGSKLVERNVFDPPRYGMLLTVLVGNGTQLFSTTLISLFFACLGFLSPANRGALMTCTMVLYVCLGTPAGYVSARLYKSFGGIKVKTNAVLTAFFCQGIVLGMFLPLNCVQWHYGSSAAIPVYMLMILLALWFGISVPLTFVGAYFGCRKTSTEQPTQINQIALQPHKQSCCTCTVPGIILGGVLPYFCIRIQSYFILNAIWSQQTYYMFDYLFLVFIVLIITCSEVTVLLCYFYLRAGDYYWWWRSFLTSGFTAVYFFFYCAYYFLTKLNMSGFTNTFLYFGYTAIIAFLLFIVTGSIGFLTCLWFVTKKYTNHA